MYSAVSRAKSEGGKSSYFRAWGMFNGNGTHRWERHTLLRMEAAIHAQEGQEKDSGVCIL